MRWHRGQGVHEVGIVREVRYEALGVGEVDQGVDHHRQGLAEAVAHRLDRIVKLFLAVLLHAFGVDRIALGGHCVALCHLHGHRCGLALDRLVAALRALTPQGLVLGGQLASAAAFLTQIAGELGFTSFPLGISLLGLDLLLLLLGFRLGLVIGVDLIDRLSDLCGDLFGGESYVVLGCFAERRVGCLRHKFLVLWLQFIYA